jgi:hypothetical protein
MSGADNTFSNIPQSAITNLVADLGAKAPLASPSLTGTPTAPTAAPGTNTTQLATTAFVAAALLALINSAPGALDTLDELAAALGDDANFAATVTAALNNRVSKTGDESIAGVKTFSSPPVVPSDTYGAGWAASGETPSKADLYEKIEDIEAGIGTGYTDEEAEDAIGAILDDATTGDIFFSYVDAPAEISGTVEKIGGKRVTISASAPSSPSTNDIWIDIS